MARFVYRLQKVFELRERKKKEQEQRVIEAQKAVRAVEVAIEEKRNEFATVRQHMVTAPHILMEAHDAYLHLLHQKLEALHEDLRRAQRKLSAERQLLIKAQADMEALVKHREKMQEEWREEENRQELKRLDEVAGQRYFRAKQANSEDDEIEYGYANEDYGDHYSDQSNQNSTDKNVGHPTSERTLLP